MSVRALLVRIGVRAATRRAWRPALDPRASRSLKLVTRDAHAIHATVTEPSAAARATVVLGHGYRDGRGQLAGVARALRAAGMRTIAFDFRAHGASEGNVITLGVRERLDVESVVAHARTLGVPVVYVGFSMGAVAYLLAEVEADVAILDAPYDTLDGAIEARTDRFLLDRRWAEAIVRAGVSLLGVDARVTRPVDRVSRLRAPTLFIFARSDAWIDAGVRARFAAQLPPNATLTTVYGTHTGHHHADYRARVVAFVRDALETIV